VLLGIDSPLFCAYLSGNRLSPVDEAPALFLLTNQKSKNQINPRSDHER
jgi:hypothetical protein